VTITVLPPPNYVRRYSTLSRDSQGRIFVYNPVFINSLPDYDPAHTGVAERYDPATLTWTTLAESPTRVQVKYGSWIDANDNWSRVGGQLINFTTNPRVDTMETFNPTTGLWNSGPSFPHTISDVSSWIDNGVPYVGGGFPPLAPQVTDLFKLIGGAWVAVASAPVRFGQDADVQDSQGRHYLVSNLLTHTTSFQRYDSVLDTWTTLATLPSASQVCAMANDTLYLLGGTNIHSYDTTQVAPGSWVTLAAHFGPTGTIVYHPLTNAIYMIGNAFAGALVANIYKYDIASDTWSVTDDSLSQGRLFVTDKNSIAYDGRGFYLGQGVDISNLAVHVFEYFDPGGTHGRSWAQIIG
jgi:hypothetical protein